MANDVARRLWRLKHRLARIVRSLHGHTGRDFAIARRPQIPVKTAEVKRSSKQYMFRALPSGALLAFVPHPDVRGAYVRVDISVVLVKCPVCKAKRGELCLGAFGRRIVSTHIDRRGLRLATQKYKILVRDAAIAVIVDGDIRVDDGTPAVLSVDEL